MEELSSSISSCRSRHHTALPVPVPATHLQVVGPPVVRAGHCLAQDGCLGAHSPLHHPEALGEGTTKRGRVERKAKRWQDEPQRRMYAVESPSLWLSAFVLTACFTTQKP